MKKPESRRSFLEKIGLGTAFATIVPNITAFSNIHHQKYEGKKLNIALVGLGRYAGYLAEGLQETQYCRLAGLVTGTPSKEETWGKKYNISEKNIYNYQNFDEIINNKDIDIVYVVLPNSMHKEFTIRAAKAGKHVFIEKPMANSAKDCLEMMQVAKENNVLLAMGYRLHYEPYHMEISRLGKEKTFGNIRLIEVSLGYNTTGPSNGPKEWRLVKKYSGGGPLMNLGVYCIQASRYITGEEPVAVTAQFGIKTDLEKFSEVEESISWQMEFPSGAVCTSTSSYNANIDRLYVAAAEGFMELSPAVSYGPYRGKTTKGELNFPDINQQAAQMDGICKVIIEGKPLPDHIAGMEGWKDMKVIDAIYKAAKTGKRVIIK